MKVYYNGSCNICNAEINHYKKTKSEISYVDISETKDEHVASLSKDKTLTEDYGIQVFGLQFMQTGDIKIELVD